MKKKRFRCEKCNKEFTTEVDCCKHERTCQPKSLEERVEDLERIVTNLQAALMQLWRMPATTPTAPAPHNPYDGPWGPVTCKDGEGPWGPLGNGATPELDVSAKPGRKYHMSICESCVNKDKKPGCINVGWDARSGGHCRNYTRGDEAADRAWYCSTCAHLADECGTVSMIKTAGGAWHCSGYCRKPCK